MKTASGYIDNSITLLLRGRISKLEIGNQNINNYREYPLQKGIGYQIINTNYWEVLILTPLEKQNAFYIL